MDIKEFLVGISVKHNGDWEKIYDAILKKEDIGDEEMILRNISKLESKYITILDDEYPEMLRKSYRPPFVLYYHGDISLLSHYNNMISVIGTRKPTNYGRYATRYFVKELSKEKIIVSGMADGIDSFAHSVTLENNGSTIAVLGSGINYIYPSTNEELYKMIKENGLIISEYPNSTVPQPNNFIVRNRIIASLSPKLLVIEANSNRSGTLTTVRFALMNGKDVLCVPKQVGKYSVCNHLIKDGAQLVDSPSDILKDK